MSAFSHFVDPMTGRQYPDASDRALCHVSRASLGVRLECAPGHALAPVEPADRASPGSIEDDADAVRTGWTATRQVVEAHHAAGCATRAYFDESGTDHRASSVAGWCFVAVAVVAIAATIFARVFVM